MLEEKINETHIWQNTLMQQHWILIVKTQKTIICRLSEEQLTFLAYLRVNRKKGEICNVNRGGDWTLSVLPSGPNYVMADPDQLRFPKPTRYDFDENAGLKLTAKRYRECRNSTC
jgi:hypothetical protein